MGFFDFLCCSKCCKVKGNVHVILPTHSVATQTQLPSFTETEQNCQEPQNPTFHSTHIDTAEEEVINVEKIDLSINTHNSLVIKFVQKGIIRIYKINDHSKIPHFIVNGHAKIQEHESTNVSIRILNHDIHITVVGQQYNISTLFAPPIYYQITTSTENKFNVRAYFERSDGSKSQTQITGLKEYHCAHQYSVGSNDHGNICLSLDPHLDFNSTIIGHQQYGIFMTTAHST